MKHTLLLFILSTFFIFSCKSDKASENSTNTKEGVNASATNNKTSNNNSTKYTLIPFKPSQSFKDAEMKGMAYKSGVFDFDVASGDYVLGSQTEDASQKMCANSGKGQHIHLIVDNKPYAAKYTNKFEYEIEDGEHYLLAFLSRSYHESIKTEKAHIAKKVSIKDNSIIEAAPIMESMLFYSRPKGTYTGKKETEKIMLDFYPINANIGTTQKIIATINGEEHEITKWQPYYITGLPLGENTITLSLVNLDDNKLSAPYNPVTRTFTLRGETAQ